MSASINYLCSRSNFKQVSNAIPITKQRNSEKYDPPEVFEGDIVVLYLFLCMFFDRFHYSRLLANKKELVDDLMTKAKQIETLIKAMPVPESEETQVCLYSCCTNIGSQSFNMNYS